MVIMKAKKKEVLEDILNNFNGLRKKYDEKEFLENKYEILSSLLNQSFFEDNKAFIIFSCVFLIMSLVLNYHLNSDMKNLLDYIDENKVSITFSIPGPCVP